jgi:hypothetical protein
MLCVKKLVFKPLYYKWTRVVFVEILVPVILALVIRQRPQGVVGGHVILVKFENGVCSGESKK